MRRYKLTVTSAADGTATAVTPRVAGKLHSIIYAKDGTNGYAAGVNFTITAKATGENIWTQSAVNASVVKYPRAPINAQDGSADLYASGGTPVADKIGLQGDQVQIVLAGAGNAKVGVFHILVD